MKFFASSSLAACLVAAMTMMMASLTSATPSAFAASYRLERLVVRSDNKSSPAYLHENPGDAAHLYQATTTQAVDPTERNEQNACKGGTAVHFSLHIANHFQVPLCFTPTAAANDSSYNVQALSHMSSTRMYAMDKEVRDLELQWSRALPVVTAATVDGSSLVLTGPLVEIRFQATESLSTEEGSA